MSRRTPSSSPTLPANTTPTASGASLSDFIARVVPWPGPGAPGVINLHWRAKNAQTGDIFWGGRPQTSPDSFVSLTKWALGRPTAIRDMYFCLSMQARVGSSRGKPTVFRSADTAVSLRAIWLDIDVKAPPKGYATFEEAVRSMAYFTNAANLPWPSALVASGGGLHVYWISDRPLSVDEWRPYAEGLKAAAIKYGLRCDAGLTTDCARILRVPETFNYKTEPPQPVTLLELNNDYDFSPALGHIAIDPATTTEAISRLPAPFDLSLFEGKKPAAAFAHLNPKDSLSAGIGHEDIPLNPRPIIMGCPFFKDAFRTHGKDHTQPLWNLTILATTFMEKGDVLAHEIGNRHPSYTTASTDAMYARKLKERTTKGLGWPSCKAIESEGCKLCAGCPHYGKIKSPLHLALPTLAQLVSSPPMAPSLPALPVWSPSTLKVSFSNLAHRRWLYGTYLIRGEVTVLASPGGAGKTALATGIAVEVATGTGLLGEKIWGGPELKVLFINGEDGGSEISRRVMAFCLAHANKIAVQSPDRLYVAGADDPRVQNLSFLLTEKNSSIINQSAIAALESALEALRPDVLILDPLIAFCGGGNMNDNALMALLIRALKQLAAKFDCAVMIVHHTRKGADGGNAEAVSGAASIVNLARRALMPVPMSEDEGNKFGVLPSERPRYLKLVDAKSNLAPRSADTPWYRLHSVELPNYEPPTYPLGDNVQAIERVNLLALSNAGMTTDNQRIRQTILDLVNRGKLIDGKAYPYSPSLAGANKERALLDDAMRAVRDATAPREWLSDDLEAVIKDTIKKLKADGSLAVKDMKKLLQEPGRFRKGRGLTVQTAPALGVKSPSNTHAAGQVPAADGGQSVNRAVSD